MEHLNQWLFILLNAAPDASNTTIQTAYYLAFGLIWIIPAGLLISWLWGAVATRQAIVSATMSGLFGLLANQLIGLLWYHPRPAEAGIGQTLVQHAQDSSFPSDHLTLIWAVAFSLLLTRQQRLAGAILAILGIPVAWARIYLGIHFPLDIVGAACVALGSAWLIQRVEYRLITRLMRVLLSLYRKFFSSLIQKGWIKS